MAIIREEFPISGKVCPFGHKSVWFHPESEYCIDCGEKLIVKVDTGCIYRCSACKSYVNESWAHCPYCGGKLS